MNLNVSAYRLLGMLISIRIHHVILTIIVLTGVLVAFPRAFIANANVWMGIILFPYALITASRPRFNYAYGFLTLAFGVLSVVYGVRMFYFFTIAFGLLTMIEYTKGKIHHLVLVLLLAMSPFFNQVTGLLGFPIRIMLSDWAGKILSFGGWDVRADGNIIVMNNSTFSVDQACMGLNMLAMSILMTVFMIAFHMRKLQRHIGSSALLALLAITFLLNIGANLIRILLLVIFTILPGHAMHELIGVICLVLYVFIPLHFITQWTIRKFGSIPEPITPTLPMNAVHRIICYIAASMILFVGIAVKQKRSTLASMHTKVELQHHIDKNSDPLLADLIIKSLDADVTKISNDRVLMYVKPIPEFFSGEHSPLFCWQGGGYEFKKIKTVSLYQHSIYIGQIINQHDKLYTAWWYSNGDVKTIEQFDWRIRMMKGENAFILINITCQSEQDLLQAVKAIFEQKPIAVNSIRI